MGIAIVRGPDSGIRITVQNAGDTPLLLPFGALIGSHYYDRRFQVVVSVPGGKDRRATYAGGPGVVGGRVDPLVLPLVPGASYTVQVPLARFVALDQPEDLAGCGKRLVGTAPLRSRLGKLLQTQSNTSEPRA
jgi:hypothetical protein